MEGEGLAGAHQFAALDGVRAERAAVDHQVEAGSYPGLGDGPPPVQQSGRHDLDGGAREDVDREPRSADVLQRATGPLDDGAGVHRRRVEPRPPGGRWFVHDP